MPILTREIDVYPEDLLSQPDLGAEPGVAWWALYTLSRQEKELMRKLRGLEVSFYCPLVARRRRSPSGRVRVAHLPLFSNYVFMYGDGETRYRAMTTNCISRSIQVPDSSDLTYDLRQIQQLIETGAALTPEARLEAGMRVRVRSGSFRGMEGVVIKRLNATRLLIAVNFLKQGASVLIDDCELERLD